MICQSTTTGGLLDRINVVHVQAIAELVDTSSDLLRVNRDVRRDALPGVPCRIGRVPCA
jgi:hypothetical protein